MPSETSSKSCLLSAYLLQGHTLFLHQAFIALSCRAEMSGRGGANSTQVRTYSFETELKDSDVHCYTKVVHAYVQLGTAAACIHT